MRISVIIPTYNEGGRVGVVVREVRRVLPEAEVLVVDGGSTDGTVGEAREAGARVVRTGRGKGLAVRKGAEEARGEVLLFLDGDGSYPSSSLPTLLHFLLSGEADLVRGSRFLGSPHFPPLRRWGNRLLSRMASLLYSPTTDLLTGMFAIRRGDLLALGLRREGFEVETELFVKATKKGMRMREVPISYRSMGGSKLSPLRDGFRILLTLLEGGG